MKRLHLVIHGKVQGVFYRHETKKKAIELSLKGWVKNVEDSVELVAEGNEGRLRDLLEWCRVGPEKCEVEFIEEEWKDCVSEFDKFEIRY